jgi:hypothetical protein
MRRARPRRGVILIGARGSLAGSRGHPLYIVGRESISGFFVHRVAALHAVRTFANTLSSGRLPAAM